MTEAITKLSEREWMEIADAQGRACACSDTTPCLGHYGVMSNDDRARVRRRVGIDTFEGRRY